MRHILVGEVRCMLMILVFGYCTAYVVNRTLDVSERGIPMSEWRDRNIDAVE